MPHRDWDDEPDSSAAWVMMIIVLGMIFFGFLA
jgi:hypothetical protein